MVDQAVLLHLEQAVRVASIARLSALTQLLGKASDDHGHLHEHDRHHHHSDKIRKIDTGHGVMALEVSEDDVPPRWQIRFDRAHSRTAKDVTLVIARPDTSRQAFSFADRGGYLESIEEIPEPHEFLARVNLPHGGHTHDYEVPFKQRDHGHDHLHAKVQGVKLLQDGEYMDPHERAHVNDISRRFQDRTTTTTGQTVMFGLTSGLIPCPAAITVLLLCLQLKQITFGIVLVVCFSLGLAVTMVSAGVIASLSVTQIQRRWTGFGAFARRMPYVSSGLMVLIAVYMAVSGWLGLTVRHPFG